MATQFALDLPPLLILLVVIGVAAAGGLVPFSPIEPILAALAAARPEMIVPAVALAAVSQMSTKSLLFLASRRASTAMPARRQEVVARLRARLEGRLRLQRLALVVSAFGGLPPFYAMTVASGIMRVPLRDFMIAGSVGRVLRFTAIALAFGAGTLGAQPRSEAASTYVLLNGMMGGSAGFRRLETELRVRGHRVLAIDPYALSIDSADVSFAAMARRVDRVLAARGVTGARLVGHGHGGGVMLRLAAAYPERVSALYFLDVGALAENRTRALSRSASLAPMLVKLPYGRDVVRRKLVDGLRENSAHDVWLDAETQLAYTTPVLDHMARVIALANRLNTAREPEPVTQVVARVRAPATVITGDAPRASRPAPAEIEALSALSGGVRVEHLRGVGHFPHEEAPAMVASLIAPPSLQAQVAGARP